MSAILSSSLKSKKSYLHQWKPENNGPDVLKFFSHYAVTLKLLIIVDGEDGNELQPES